MQGCRNSFRCTSHTIRAGSALGQSSLHLCVPCCRRCRRRWPDQQWSQIEAANKATPGQAKLSSVRSSCSSPWLFIYRRLPVPSALRAPFTAARSRACGSSVLMSTTTGRQVNASPWISMLTIDGRIKFQLGFDTKFHDTDKMQQFMDGTFSWLQLCAASALPLPASTPLLQLVSRVASPVPILFCLFESLCPVLYFVIASLKCRCKRSLGSLCASSVR